MTNIYEEVANAIWDNFNNNHPFIKRDAESAAKAAVDLVLERMETDVILKMIAGYLITGDADRWMAGSTKSYNIDWWIENEARPLVIDVITAIRGKETYKPTEAEIEAANKHIQNITDEYMWREHKEECQVTIRQALIAAHEARMKENRDE